MLDLRSPVVHSELAQQGDGDVLEAFVPAGWSWSGRRRRGERDFEKVERERGASVNEEALREIGAEEEEEEEAEKGRTWRVVPPLVLVELFTSLEPKLEHVDERGSVPFDVAHPRRREFPPLWGSIGPLLFEFPPLGVGVRVTVHGRRGRVLRVDVGELAANKVAKVFHVEAVDRVAVEDDGPVREPSEMGVLVRGGGGGGERGHVVGRLAAVVVRDPDIVLEHFGIIAQPAVRLEGVALKFVVVCCKDSSKRRRAGGRVGLVPSEREDEQSRAAGEDGLGSLELIQECDCALPVRRGRKMRRRRRKRQRGLVSSAVGGRREAGVGWQRDRHALPRLGAGSSMGGIHD